MMYDYFIVGGGLAGIAFAERALAAGKRILLFDDGQNNASSVAAGIYNPVVVKRLTAVADADAHLIKMHEFYDSVEQKLSQTFRFKMPMLRRFASVEEQNDWFVASDKPKLTQWLSPELISETIPGLDSSFGYGKVLGTGFVRTAELITRYHDWLMSELRLHKHSFDFSRLHVSENRVDYGDLTARDIVFSEGFRLKQNRFFSYLPLNGTKGELLTILARKLQLECIVNAGIFILPFGDGIFKVGATYEWEDKTNAPTQQAREEIESKLSSILTCDYQVIAHAAGVRPTVRDRKPLIGTHYAHKNVHVLNGLGTRGVMLAPAMADFLLESIESGVEVPTEVNIRRYDSLLQASGS